MGPLIAIFFPIIMGAYLIYKHSSVAILTIRSRKWPTTEGVVEESYIGCEEVEGKVPFYIPMIKYKFLVEEYAYIGRRINWSTKKSSNENIIKKNC